MLATARISQKMAGAAGKTAERARYIQLTRQGLNNSEICRQLGIGRKTGCTWRNGHSTRDPSGARRYHPPIVEVRESVVSARFLSEDERVHIADLRRTGAGIRQIATVLGRSASTVSRELRRNATKAGGYRPFHAHRLARNRRARERPSKIASNAVLRQTIQNLLE
ncbi:helix-turn-helix domain-containing protein [Rhodococcus erythropolis]|uniref:helix-turn-helix domain-containing protein n=1 Tax=Rhodococcus erythropolis TaxID=1833 RepID=UPI00294A57E8|nr:helix-turn-helix domain-containing protein [Rhodococcus erythropolis]MDV6278332.1 helix-turn-helix domain-containing protein [Rhodococcus erythropolis]